MGSTGSPSKNPINKTFYAAAVTSPHVAEFTGLGETFLAQDIPSVGTLPPMLSIATRQ